jgi:hypothetical protein
VEAAPTAPKKTSNQKISPLHPPTAASKSKSKRSARKSKASTHKGKASTHTISPHMADSDISDEE